MKERKFSVKNYLKVDTGVNRTEILHKSFSFSDDPDIAKNSTNNRAWKIFSDDHITPRFSCDINLEKELKHSEPSFEWNDGNISENVKVSKVKTEEFVNTLKIGLNEVSPFKLNTNTTQESELFIDHCRNIKACGCIIY